MRKKYTSLLAICFKSWITGVHLLPAFGAIDNSPAPIYIGQSKPEISKGCPMKTQAIIDHIVHWLTGYVEAAGMNGFVVGVSGGIDSAVTSSLCARTGKPVLLLNMPIYQSADQVKRSSDHIQALAADYPNVTGADQDLTPAFAALETGFPAEIQDDLTMANSRSRLRMLTLYAYAGHHRMLVAGTGNKVEDFGVGFYTKYGDGGVDLSPIADLVKSQVYELGRALGVRESILKAPPTDGLFGDDRTDEGQIGASYDELEAAMAHEALPEAEKTAAETTLSSREKEVLAIYRQRHRANRHKMEPIPVCTIPRELLEG